MSTRSVSNGNDRFAVHVVRGRDCGNGAKRWPASLLSRGLGLVALASAMAACSLSFPIDSFKADDTPTGSIDRFAATLSPALDREDWRRARAALGVTLDPQGNGERANWSNPESGSKGSFTAVGPPFPDRDRVCRKFDGEVLAGTGPGRRVSGSACRDAAGDWALRDTSDRRAS